MVCRRRSIARCLRWSSFWRGAQLAIMGRPVGTGPRTRGGARVDRKWEVDEANTVTAHFGAFGKKVISVNGSEAYNSRKMSRKGEIDFSLPDGRGAVLAVKPEFIGRPTIHLRVAGNLVVETPKKQITCGSCGEVAKPYDRFCAKCGKPMPTAEDSDRRAHTTATTSAI